MTHQQPYSFYEERRKYPRVMINSPIVIYHNDSVLNGKIHDISEDGLQVRCDRKTLQLIHPDGKFIRKHNAPIVNVLFHLAIKGQQFDISVKCLMYYFVVLPDSGAMDIACGLRFISLDDRTSIDINAFIENAMTPPEEIDIKIMSEPRTIKDISAYAALNTHDVRTELLNFLKAREIDIPDSNENNNYKCLVAAIEALFEKSAEIENRLYRIEQKIEDN
jgi:PilZ domain